MNLFRVPMNVVVITMLVLANYFDPFVICLMVSFVLIFSWLATLYLIYYYYKYLEKTNMVQPVPAELTPAIEEPEEDIVEMH